MTGLISFYDSGGPVDGVKRRQFDKHFVGDGGLTCSLWAYWSGELLDLHLLCLSARRGGDSGFFTWLPTDGGSDSASALIHAATMVTAGVYLRAL